MAAGFVGGAPVQRRVERRSTPLRTCARRAHCRMHSKESDTSQASPPAAEPGLAQKLAQMALAAAAVTLQNTVSAAQPSMWAALGSALSRPSAALAAVPFKFKGVRAKLEQVPVFHVTSASGHPYLASMEEDSYRVSLIFFSREDAAKMQEQVQVGSKPEEANVTYMSLDKAIELVRSKPISTGLKDQNGNDIPMVWRLYPDSRQVRNANRILGRRNAIAQQVPLFVVRGLVVRKGRENIQPLFFVKEDIDAVWEQIRAQDPKLPRRPHVEVYGFQDVLERMESDEGSFRDWGFFPSTFSVETLRLSREAKSGVARMHMNPLQMSE